MTKFPITNGREPNTLNVEKCMMTVIPSTFPLKYPKNVYAIPDVIAERSATISGNGSDWKLGRNTMNAPSTDRTSAGIWIGGKLLLHEHSCKQSHEDRRELI